MGVECEGEGVEPSFDPRLVALAEVLLAEQLVGDLDGDEQRDALEREAPAPAAELADVGVDVVGELLDLLRTVVAAYRQGLSGDLDADGLLHR